MMNKRFIIVFLLGFSSGLPLALLTSTLQAWFAEAGLSVLAIGMLSIVGLPYVCRMIWAPLLDRYVLFSMGRRRSWMLMTQVSLWLGFNLLACFTPVSSPQALALVAFILAFFSATQDAAIDAHRTEYLNTHEHALGASLAVFGSRFALLISGGLALLLANKLGFSVTYHMMSMLMLIGILATCWSSEPSQSLMTNTTLMMSCVAPLRELASRRDIVPFLLFIVLYKLGESFTTTSSGIVMPFLIQGIGFSLDTIGYINKMLGVASTILGGLIAGVLLLRWSLYKALLVFGLLQAVTNLLFVALAIAGKNIPLFAIAVTFDNFAAGMGSTALVALFMRLVNRQFTATQFSLFVAIATLPRIVSGPVAALLQSWLGWVGFYQVSCLLALAFIPFLRIIGNQIAFDCPNPRTIESEVTSYSERHLGVIGSVKKPRE